MDLSDVLVNHSEIDQSLLDIDQKERSSLLLWKGQFSPQLIGVLLDKYSSKDSVVYDPFVGSGTVLLECARKGIAAYGVELNPAAYYMADFIKVCTLSKEGREFVISYMDNKVSSYTGNVKTWYESIEDHKNLAALLIILCESKREEVTSLASKWNYLRNLITGLPYTDRPIEVFNSDSRNAPINDNTANLLITSPPYINVMNYHQQYRPSVESLGYNVLGIAKDEIGSNRKNRGNRFLTVSEYVVDMTRSLLDHSRILKDGSRMIYIVGRSSKVLGVPFCDSNIIYQIASAIGLPITLRQERCYKNRYGKIIHEDILHFENAKSQHMGSVMNGACQVATEALVTARDNVDDNTKVILIDKALSRTPKMFQEITT